ncbi:family 43 glycosylhydrolase [Demequina sp. NBRC 110057]|uniref:family 43 glycosylhydrolase n=1 Tax=Demequina sp. NBRC 110057 TaxID=1570346 RepID=UPI0011774A9A|nr:family 43 glycosylhydrolase [Demequina sp. NBRC 110057]
MTDYYCNPLDLEYRYQETRFSGMVQGMQIAPARRSVHREAADPSIVRYQGRYFMFVSMSRGFWHSADLASWTYQPTEKLPAYDYAPDVRVVNGSLLISASRKGKECPFFRSDNPLSDDFIEVSPGSFAFWDPAVFQDDDGRVFLYWGCDAVLPIYGVELDDQLRPIGDPAELIHADVETRGWERPGENHVVPEPTTDLERKIAQFSAAGPFLEGAWMTRVGERYYLQYAGPGTQWNTYADGYFVSDSPLGPFTYSDESPFSYKPGGFITGAGHGSTFEDEHGNWWHAATMRISVNDIFERRVGIFPAGFDDDGVLYCNQEFADYPTAVPRTTVDPRDVTEPEWMLLSYKATTSASSAKEGFTSDKATDEDIRTWWAAGSSGEGEWIAVDLGEEMRVSALQINLADENLASSAPENTDGADMGHTWRSIYSEHDAALIRIEGSVDGETWDVLHDGAAEGRDRPHALIVLDAATPLRHVRVIGLQVPFSGTFAVSGLRVFGRAPGERPSAVDAPRAVRAEGRTAVVEWDGVAGALGYNVRFGSRADKLYRSWMVYGSTRLDIPALNAGTDVWVAVDAFNGSGVSRGEPVRAVAAEVE